MVEKIGCSICGNLDDDLLVKISEIASVITLKAGGLIFDQGELSEAFFVITRGSVKLSKLSEGGKELVIKVAHPPESLGCYSLFGNERYTERAECLDEVVLLEISKKEFISLLGSESQLNFNFLNAIAAWLNTVNSILESLNFSTVEQRTMAFFEGHKEKWQIDFLRNLKNNEIAALLNMRPETYSRVLKTLESEGRIERTNLGIVVKKP